MPIATPPQYADMLDRAKEGGFAYPAINVTSSETLNAALRGFADAGSDGIIQVSTGGAEFAVGTTVKDMVTGAVALAEFAHVVAAQVPDPRRAAHRPLPEGQARQLRPPADRASRRSASTAARTRCSSRTCGTARRSSSRRTCRSRPSCWRRPPKAQIILEVEIGVVGGEEDGVVGEMNEKLYTTPGDALRTAEMLGTGEKGRYLLAATFGNVHGVYKPGNVKLRPDILKELQDAVGDEGRQAQAVRPGLPRRLRLGARGDPRGASPTAWSR